MPVNNQVDAGDIFRQPLGTGLFIIKDSHMGQSDDYIRFLSQLRNQLFRGIHLILDSQSFNNLRVAHGDDILDGQPEYGNLKSVELFNDIRPANIFPLGILDICGQKRNSAIAICFCNVFNGLSNS